MKKQQYLLTWGESVIIRQRFVETFGSTIILGHKELENLSYTKHSGEPELIELARQCIKRQTGMEYKHILITNGATGGITITMRAYYKQGYKKVVTRDPPYFSLYPRMIDAAGMKHVIDMRFENDGDEIFLLDNPTNPTGKTCSVLHLYPKHLTILDAVYHSNCYTTGNPIVPWHNVQVGSFSKLTGLNGLRLGWIATDDDLLYDRLKVLVEAEYAGLSRPSGEILLALVKGKEDRWDEFESMSRYWMDMNRTEWSKLERFFGNTPVSPIGMFFYSPMDEACKRLMEKAGVQYMLGSNFGHIDSHGRFNIGQCSKVVQGAVKAVLKADKICTR